METATVGKTLVSAKIENAGELYAAHKGLLPEDQVHWIEVADALVDTGASHLSMPKGLIHQLDLPHVSVGHARTTAGMRTFELYGPVRLTVQGRTCSVDVAEIADECPVLIGYVPLELLDFVVDPKNQRLIGNPAHGGEFMIDMF
jgi:predicted aspartyl protease